MKKLILIALLLAIPVLVAAQARRKMTGEPKTVPNAAPVGATAPAPTPETLVPPPTPVPGKKNGRPAQTVSEAPKKDYAPVYVYTFDRPGFKYSSIRIEHDEDGRGRVWFKQDGGEETLDDPLQVSTATMAILKKTFDDMHFLDSTEDYQFPGHDYSNMGNLTITLNRSGQKRTVKYNWTDNKQAKLLMDTYRAISNEATFKFEIEGASVNQPLLTPGIVDTLDSYLGRGEIADPQHLVPYLTKLSEDERLPLIARNHLNRLIAQINRAKH